MIRAEPAGFFGKLPTSRRLRISPLAPGVPGRLGRRLQRCIGESRSALGDGWLERYLTSPIWRFAMTSGVCGSTAWIGLLMPSVDRVGRYFPLSIVSPVSKGASALSFAISAARWSDAAERILLTVLSESEPHLNVFDRQVLELTQNLVDLDCLQRPPAQKSDAGEYWKLEVPETAPQACRQ